MCDKIKGHDWLRYTVFPCLCGKLKLSTDPPPNQLGGRGIRKKKRMAFVPRLSSVVRLALGLTSILTETDWVGLVTPQSCPPLRSRNRATYRFLLFLACTPFFLFIIQKQYLVLWVGTVVTALVNQVRSNGA